MYYAFIMFIFSFKRVELIVGYLFIFFFFLHHIQILQQLHQIKFVIRLQCYQPQSERKQFINPPNFESFDLTIFYRTYMLYSKQHNH